MTDKAKGAGGTPGGLGTFFFGLVLAALGGYLVLNQITVHSNFSFWGWPGSQGGGFGGLFIALLFGIGFLFFDAKSMIGWALTIAAGVAIIVSVIMNLNVLFRPTSLLVAVFMFGSLAAGLGLIFRSFKSFPDEEPSRKAE